MSEDPHMREALIREGLLPRIHFGSFVSKDAPAKLGAAVSTMTDDAWSKLTPSARLTAAMKREQR